MQNGRAIEITPDEAVFTDDFHARMIGNPDAKDSDEDSYLNSVMWDQREKIWTALGENDASKYLPKGIADEGDESAAKVETSSEELSTYLWGAITDWGEAVWMRLVSVPDPYESNRYEDKQTGAEKRQQLITVAEFFEDEAQAQKAATEEMESRSK